MNPTRMLNLLVRSAGVVVAITAIILLAFALHDLYFGLASRHWPHTRGTILADFVEHSPYQVPIGGLRDRDRPPGTKTYFRSQWNIAYAYVVSGHRYQSVGVSYDARSLFESHAGQYRRRTDVEVYYDPSNPARAVLEPGISRSNLILLHILALIALVGVYFHQAGLRSFRRRRRNGGIGYVRAPDFGDAGNEGTTAPAECEPGACGGGEADQESPRRFD